MAHVKCEEIHIRKEGGKVVEKKHVMTHKKAKENGETHKKKKEEKKHEKKKEHKKK